MITVCPKCELALAVSAADLRTAGGHVRCGRCAAVFNALAALYDETTLSETARGRRIALDFELPPEPPPEPLPEQPPAPMPPAAFAPAPTSRPPPPASLHASPPAPPPLSAATAAAQPSVDRLPPEIVAEATSPPAAAPPVPDLGEQTMEADDLATLIARPRPAAVEVEANEEIDVAPIPIEDDSDLEVTVIPSTPERTAEPAPPSHAPSAPEPQPPAPPEPALGWLLEDTNRAAEPVAAADTAAPPGASTDAALPPPATAAGAAADEFIAEVAQRDEPAGARGAAWPVAAGVLALALLLQVGHRYRAELAALPALERAVTGVYATLGRPVVPQWPLGAYEVQQNGAFADAAAGGVLEVRASIRNRGDRAQPAPLLRVILEDRFANRIAARDVEPAEYLARANGAPAAADAPRIAPGRRLDATIALADPGGNAVGFEIDVCLRRTGGAIACANDAGDGRP